MKGDTMAKTKKVTKKHEMIDSKTENLISSPVTPAMTSASVTKARWIGIALLIILAAVVLMKKGYVVAAIVNGRPIFRWELNAQLANRFGAQTLDSMITEQLIADAAKKQGVEITQADIDAKVMTITQTLGEGVNLEELLKYQGMTKADFEHQVRLQLTVEKVLGKDVAVTDSEVDTFIAENREAMTATDEAKDTLMSQKTSEKMQPWLMELRENAKVTKLFQ
jgi:foldase protein PrsA